MTWWELQGEIENISENVHLFTDPFSTQGLTSIFLHVSPQGISTPKVRQKQHISPTHHLSSLQYFFTNLDQNSYPQPPEDLSTSKFQYEGKKK